MNNIFENDKVRAAYSKMYVCESEESNIPKDEFQKMVMLVASSPEFKDFIRIIKFEDDKILIKFDRFKHGYDVYRAVMRDFEKNVNEIMKSSGWEFGSSSIDYGEVEYIRKGGEYHDDETYFNPNTTDGDLPISNYGYNESEEIPYVDEQAEKNVSTNSHKLVDDSNPAVWIGTYGNYNGGSLGGEGEASGWIDLTTFDDADEFHDWLAEQAGGKDVEWMFQDYMNFPSSLYGESDIDGVWEYIDFKNNTWLTDEQIDDILNDGISLEDLMEKSDNGDIRIYNGCRTMGDVAQQMIDEMGEDAFSDSDYQNAFDYESFGRDIDIDWDSSAYDGKSAYETLGVSEDDDKALGEEYVNQMYGDISGMEKESIMRYIDFDDLGSDLRYDGTWIESGDNLIQIL